MEWAQAASSGEKISEALYRKGSAAKPEADLIMGIGPGSTEYSVRRRLRSTAGNTEYSVLATE